MQKISFYVATTGARVIGPKGIGDQIDRVGDEKRWMQVWRNVKAALGNVKHDCI